MKAIAIGLALLGLLASGAAQAKSNEQKVLGIGDPPKDCYDARGQLYGAHYHKLTPGGSTDDASVAACHVHADAGYVFKYRQVGNRVVTVPLGLVP